jgi:lysozyme
MVFSRWISAVRPLVAAGLLALTVGGCGVLGDNDFETATKVRPVKATPVRYTSAHYPMKGDSDPHPGVARVHTLPIHGIDVSRYQENIDWAAVRRAGTRFAFIKATEGGDYVDPKFYRNWRGAGDAGIPRAAYHFIYWCRPAREQAEWFIRHVPRDATGLPPVIDAEWVNNSRNCKRRVSKEDALAKVKIISGMLAQYYGKLPIIYTDINFHKDVLEGEHLENAFWLRSTAAEPHERYRGRRWTLWQWTQTGTVPGIKGGVDRNAFYGSEREWSAFLATGCDPRQSPTNRCRGSGMMVAQASPLPAAPRPLPPAPVPVLEAYAAETAGSGNLDAFIASLPQ